MRALSLLLSVFFFSSLSLHAQLLVEDFDYPAGDSLTTHSWTAHSGTTTPVVVTTPSLTFPSYPGSGIGDATTVTGGSGSREDVNKTFLQQTSGIVYAAFMIQVSSAANAADYFFHLGPEAIGTTFRGRVFIRKDTLDSSLLSFGLSQSSTPGSFTPFSYSTNTTYLLVLKYLIVAGADNDEVSLFVFTSPAPSSEPTSATLGPLTGTSDPPNIGSIALRQGATAYNVVVDGLEVGTTWFEVGLPVQLSGFSGYVQYNEVHLEWTTLSEINNYGFVVERAAAPHGEWQEVPGSFVPGYGTTSQPHFYSYVHTGVLPGAEYYRLRQIDLNGTRTYSDPILIDIPTSVQSSVPSDFRLDQNFPNPFNPSTEIEFSVDSHGPTTLVVFNILGQPVATLYQGNAEPKKNYSVRWNTQGFPSGPYFYKLEGGRKTSMKKMTLLK